MLLRFLCAFLLLALGGCAAYKIDKAAVPAAADVLAIGKEIAKARDFQQAVYDVSTFAVDRCERKTTREPFSLLTLGTLEPHLSKEKIAAYYRAGGFDEQWHVLWAQEGSGLKPGDAIDEINGAKIENNKTGMGEAPLAKYFNALDAGRDAAARGAAFRVKRADGREVPVAMKPACRTTVWAMPLQGANAAAEVNFMGPVVIPANAIHEARSESELRYLAALAVYFSASAEAAGKRSAGMAGMGLVSSLLVINPLLYAATTFPAAAAIRSMSTSGMVENAAVFATQVVADMGGSPSAGLELLARLEAKKLGADRVLLDADSRARIAALAAKLAQLSPGLR